MGDFLTGKLTEILRHGSEAGDTEDIASQHRVGYLEVVFVFDMTYAEKTVGYGASFLDNLLILSLFWLFLCLGLYVFLFDFCRVGNGGILLKCVSLYSIKRLGLNGCCQHQSCCNSQKMFVNHSYLVDSWF